MRLGYIHFWLSIHSSSSSSSSYRSDLFWTCVDQLWLTCWKAQSIHHVEYIKTRQGRCSTCIIGSWFAALLLLLIFLLLQRWLPPIFCRSTPIDSLVTSIDLTGRVHPYSVRTPGYVHYWFTICCSTPPHCLPICLPLQVWPISNCCRLTLISLLAGWINFSHWVH